VTGQGHQLLGMAVLVRLHMVQGGGSIRVVEERLLPTVHRYKGVERPRLRLLRNRLAIAGLCRRVAAGKVPEHSQSKEYFIGAHWGPHLSEFACRLRPATFTTRVLVQESTSGNMSSENPSRRCWWLASSDTGSLI
jgi:hypothetical protein